MKIKLKEIIEIVLIFVLVLLVYRVLLVWLFKNPYPMVVVVSGSMRHDINLEEKHFRYLEERFGYNRSFIKSWPIKNGFGEGDVLVVIKYDNYNIGDVVVFRNKCHNIPISHRIIAINEDGTFQTKGDNNFGQNISPCYDERKISKDDIYGKVVLVIPKIGLIRYAFYKIFGF
ncbi:MAG: hypothetical protein QXV63_00990 [Candidatus Aenigmatarchaeota archaeon]|nr:hypothetical protein [Candidatus Aenigmarchaeota archaeon]